MNKKKSRLCIPFVASVYVRTFFDVEGFTMLQTSTDTQNGRPSAGECPKSAKIQLAKIYRRLKLFNVAETCRMWGGLELIFDLFIRIVT